MSGEMIKCNEIVKFETVMEKHVNSITIEELADEVNMFSGEQGISFKITENFTKKGLCSCLVRGLYIEVENEFVFCSDPDNILMENYYVIMAFLKDCIENITRTITLTERYGIINLTDGSIRIDVID